MMADSKHTILTLEYNKYYRDKMCRGIWNCLAMGFRLKDQILRGMRNKNRIRNYDKTDHGGQVKTFGIKFD